MHGVHQVIPGVGAHTQHYVTADCVQVLVAAGLIQYEPDYGPDARVFRPTPAYWDADTEQVARWIDAWAQTWASFHDHPQIHVMAVQLRLGMINNGGGDG